MPIRVVALVTINPDEAQALQRYMDVTTPLLEEVGARIVQQAQVQNVVVGDEIAERLMVVEYPDLDALDKVFKSAAYKSVIPSRDKAFKTYNVSILSD